MITGRDRRVSLTDKRNGLLRRMVHTRWGRLTLSVAVSVFVIAPVIGLFIYEFHICLAFAGLWPGPVSRLLLLLMLLVLVFLAPVLTVTMAYNALTRYALRGEVAVPHDSRCVYPRTRTYSLVGFRVTFAYLSLWWALLLLLGPATSPSRALKVRYALADGVAITGYVDSRRTYIAVCQHGLASHPYPSLAKSYRKWGFEYFWSNESHSRPGDVVLLIGCSPLWCLLALLAPPVPIFGLPALGRYRRKQRGQCITCGYSLRGFTKPRCPECGAAFGLEEDTRG